MHKGIRHYKAKKPKTQQLNFNKNSLRMENLLTQIKEQMEVFSSNADAQLTKNNKAAGTRARKAALEISKLMKEFRRMSVEVSKE